MFAKKRKRKGIPSPEPTNIQYIRVVGTTSINPSPLYSGGIENSYIPKQKEYNVYKPNFAPEPDYQKPVFDDYVDKLRNIENSYEQEAKYRERTYDNQYENYERIPSRGNVSGKHLYFSIYKIRVS